MNLFEAEDAGLAPDMKTHSCDYSQAVKVETHNYNQ